MPLLKGRNLAGYFLLQGHNLNKHGRGALDDATYQYSRSYGMRQELFFNVPLYKPMLTI